MQDSLDTIYRMDIHTFFHLICLLWWDLLDAGFPLQPLNYYKYTFKTSNIDQNMFFMRSSHLQWGIRIWDTLWCLIWDYKPVVLKLNRCPTERRENHFLNHLPNIRVIELKDHPPRHQFCCMRIMRNTWSLWPSGEETLRNA